MKKLNPYLQSSFFRFEYKMKFYIGLQFKIINRHLIAAGIYPMLFYIAVTFTFFGLSTYLFDQSRYAEYIYGLVAASILASLSSKSRNNFLKNINTKANFYKLKSIENSLLILPFFLFLMFKEKYIVGFTLLILANLMYLINLENKIRFSFPTPFYRYPFEFTIGFRKSYFIVLSAYFINLMGILSENFSLSIFSLIAILLTCFSFYTKPEPSFFIWIFSKNPKKFIKAKLQTTIIYTLLLCLPITASMSIFFPEDILIIFIIQLVGLFVAMAALLGKYSQYPSEINLIQGMSIGLSMIFPPLLFIIIPLFYFQSIKRLSEILK